MYAWSGRLAHWLAAIAVMVVGSAALFVSWTIATDREQAQAVSAYGAASPAIGGEAESALTPWPSRTRQHVAFASAVSATFLCLIALFAGYLRRLQYSEDRFRRLFEATRTAVAVIRGDVIIDANTEFVHMFRVQENKSIIGADAARFCGAILRQDDFAAPDLKKQLPRARSGETVCTEGRLTRRNGEQFDADIVIAPLDQRGENLLLLVLRDISDRKVNEADIRQLNSDLEKRVAERTAQLTAANDELESFSSSISHDLRSPLNRICGYAAILQADAPALGGQWKRQLDVISNEAGRMSQMVEDLLALARLDHVELRKTRVELSELVDDALESCSDDTKGRDIEWVIDALPVVMADRRLLRQVFVNLLGNAVKYTRGRSPATIHIGVDASASREGEVVVFIRDNGAGFDMKFAKKLFGVFQRLHSAQEFEGTGVGLANVRRIVRRHGGRVWANAEPDRGATFYFALPA